MGALPETAEDVSRLRVTKGDAEEQGVSERT